MRARARDDSQLLESARLGQLLHDVAGHVLVGRLGGHAHQLAQRFGADVRVGIGPEEVAEHRRVEETRRGGAADPGFGIVAGHRHEHVGLVGPDFVHSGDAHTGIGVLPARL